MKATTRIVLKVIYNLSLDNLFASLAASFSVLTKLVPHPTFYEKNDEVKVKRNSAFFQVNRSDWMQWSIYAQLEDHAWKYSLKFLEKLGRSNLVIMDIGSNVGAFSFKVASNLMKQGLNDFTIYAFDPNPYIKEYFEKNKDMNPVSREKIHFKSVALSDFNGKAFFDFTNENSGGGSLRENGFPVEVATLDSFCENQQVGRIDFIKIDVEGFEPFVFSGGKKIIEKSRPGIYAEISPFLYQAKNRSPGEVFEYFFRHNYRLYKDRGTKLELIDRKSYDHLFNERMFNILAEPAEVTHDFHQDLL